MTLFAHQFTSRLPLAALLMLCLALQVLTAGCGTQITELRPLAEQEFHAKVPFIGTGMSKDEVLARWDRDWAYADAEERMIVYRLAFDDRGQPAIDYRGSHELVLIFNRQGALTRHSLIRVR